MRQADAPIPFAGGMLGTYRHVCMFFSTPGAEYDLLLPFIKEGLDRGDKAFHIVDPARKEEHVQRLGAAGVDVAASQAGGRLAIEDWNDTYLFGGSFDKERMLALIQATIDAGHEQGFPYTRVIGPAMWVLEERPGVDDLVEYETRLNYFLPRYRDPVICLYDLSKFDAGLVVDILRTHPMVVIGGVLQVNPFYVPPDEFLRELRARPVTRRALPPAR